MQRTLVACAGACFPPNNFTTYGIVTENYETPRTKREVTFTSSHTNLCLSRCISK